MIESNTLSFYDHHRQSYHDTCWSLTSRDDRLMVAEFMLGDYGPFENGETGGVAKGGEFAIEMIDLHHGTFGSLRLRVFGESMGSLQFALANGLDECLYDTIGVGEEGRNELTERLLECGFIDKSHRAIGEEAPPPPPPVCRECFRPLDADCQTPDSNA